jgi:hypothetical protein
MKKMHLFFIALLFIILQGKCCCESLDANSLDAEIMRMKAAKLLHVPIPNTTPYDADPKAKKIYLEEYRSGYRTVLAEVWGDCHMGVKSPYFKAYQHGWSDGIADAKKEHPEKAAAELGISLEEYLRFMKSKQNDSKK